MKKRRLMIVIEETGADGGKGFNLYLSGDKERLGTISPDNYSPAEFWASKLFTICCDAVTLAGSVKTVNGVPVPSD